MSQSYVDQKQRREWRLRTPGPPRLAVLCVRGLGGIR